ncbi:hypothetical protein CERSUDRAFT_150928 [Gelatoporia subvermispora B]|uniref:Heterokaryon incompatibility domain-containing protein n=1 Tax=Ceriporiopsis subvermispora (strain B) TaxID=914234 RepID=M2R620_CERS8|nr:hypothetical protein CERSUDRAFT_150928 [Gelatoporia subvermispora B]
MPANDSILIYDLPVDSHCNPKIDLSSFATPCRYRLVDCAQFIENRKLSITELSSFPSVPYTAISYVWRGRPDLEGRTPEAFVVAGAEEADPIAVSVLRHACMASLLHKIPFIWLDRLCILQTSKMDKQWQIREMYRIYQSCALCVVLPGGLMRLVPLSEETDWIHRGWTLQEAVVPKKVVVLHAWAGGSGSFTPDTGGSLSAEMGYVTPVVPGESAVTVLSRIIEGCLVGGFFLTTPHHYDSTEITPDKRRECRILGARTPNLAALAAVVSEEFGDDARHHSIWQCALMRTSSRPVDMVFSIMGLFGVNLDPRSFDENDRMGATIALAKEILRQGGIASWLGMAFRIPPSSRLSIFPEFPETSVAGKAVVKTSEGLREVIEMMDIEYPNEGPSLQSRMPGGMMDDAGFLYFSARCAPAMPVSAEVNGNKSQQIEQKVDTRMRAVASDGSEWDIYTDGSNTVHSEFYAVLLGWFDPYYPGATPKYDRNIKVVLVEGHAPDRYRVRCFVSLGYKLHAWVATWGERRFCLC